MNVALLFLILYFVVMAGIGVWTTRRSSTSTEDYLLAGRSLGPAVTALRLQSSSMSGYMFLGAGSLGYTQGYFGMWYALGDLGGGIMNLSILGRATGVIVLYTFLGGYLAVAYTDFVQAIVMLVGMLWILIATLQAVGGFAEGNRKVGAINQNLLTMWGADLHYQGQWGVILGALMIFSIGYLGWPHVVVSHMAMKQPSVARGAGAYSMIFNYLFIPAPYLIGTFALVILPELNDSEQAIFQVAQTVLPSFAVGIVMAAVMAAIMSTADALLLQASTIAAKDIMARFFLPAMTERQMVLISRAMVLLIAVAGIGLAIWQPPAVFSLVIFATTVLGSAFVPSYVCAVWWKKANAVGAVCSIIAGSVAAVLWKLCGSDAIDPMVAGIASSTVAMVVGSLATQRTHPVPADIVDAMIEAARVAPVTDNPQLAAQFPDD